MELPKNIIQIGKPDRIHKIFVEDYVVSYIKQLNKSCDGKATGLALYGRFFEQEECRYYFLYGAAAIEGLEHRGPYLSQVEKEEIEDVGKRYFSEYEFLAWCSVKEEPVESFFVQAQGKGVEINGYACFYEKNESMLNYMLLSGEQNKTRENITEKTEEKKAGRGEWAAAEYIRPAEKPASAKSETAKKTGHMKMAAAAVFLVLCVVGITTLNDYDKLSDLQVAARQVIANLSEQKLPDAQTDDGMEENGIYSEQKTEQQIQNGLNNTIQTGQEDKNTGEQATDMQTVPGVQGTDIQTVPGTQGTDVETVPGAQGTDIKNSQQGQEVSENSVQTETNVVSEEQVLPISYTVVKGDTLISICMRKYGSLERIAEICELNKISDADSIQVGQTILLP